MKDTYIKPLISLEAFELSDILTESETEVPSAAPTPSGGIGDTNNDGGEI